ncbi:MAG TPA: hypothetical protein VIH09_10255 [Flavobacterium sp.]|uniref:hypothetical protein n=1 Tax=Flavobacterium sp. TaxID=239 RepID=UPI002F3F1407
MKKIVKFNWLTIVVFMVCSNANAQQNAKTMLKDKKQQGEIFKAISGDSIQMRQFNHYIMKQKRKNNVIDNQEITMGNSMNMMENDSILMKRTHRE